MRSVRQILSTHERIDAPIGTKKRVRRPRVQPTSPGYLYLLRGVHGFYKIGLSDTPQDRVATLGVQLPFAIEVTHLIKTNNMKAAEGRLHTRYADKRVNGEWFKLDETDVTAICAISEINIEEVVS